MASREVNKLLEENEGSNDSISNSGSSAEPKSKDEKDNHRFTESCPAVLEPSKDEWRRFEGGSKNLLKKLLTSSCPQPSTHEVSISSSSESSLQEDEQQRSSEHQTSNEQTTNDPPTNCCANVLDFYNSSRRKIRDSWFIFVFQIFIGVLCISAIVMGSIFFHSCEGYLPYTDPILTILMGISGLFLLRKWVSKVCRRRWGEYFWNHDKNKLITYLIAVLLFMALEMMLCFSQMSPKALQAKKEFKCAQTYYDYLYYLHIANAGVLVLAAFLYLPDCCLYLYAIRQPRPTHANGHYQPL